MILRSTLVVAALLALPVVANAQGFFDGARGGYAEGDRRAGPIGGIVGGAVGAGVGTFNGALGIRPEGAVVTDAGYGPMRRHHRRHHRYHHGY